MPSCRARNGLFLRPNRDDEGREGLTGAGVRGGRGAPRGLGGGTAVDARGEGGSHPSGPHAESSMQGVVSLRST